jgi:indole-3-acetate monooxygenase
LNRIVSHQDNRTEGHWPNHSREGVMTTGSRSRLHLADAAWPLPSIGDSHTPRLARNTQLLAAARVLAPRIRAFADRIEQERRLPAELVADLVEAGLFKMALPCSLGGGGAGPVTTARVVEELARADASVAWCVMLAAQAAVTPAFLPETAAREVFAAPDTIVAWVLRPVGRAVPVEGGYRVTGRWPFASGSTHATWLAGEAVVMDGDEPERDVNGRTVVRLLFMPRADCAVHDTWHSTGLRGTGSNDFSAENVYVPEHRSYRIHVDPPIRPAPIHRVLGLFALGHGSHALGVAQAAFDAVIAMAAATGGGEGTAVVAQTRLQEQVAEAQALIESARSYFYQTAIHVWSGAVVGRESSAAERARLRLAISHAVRSAVQAVDLLYAAMTTRAIVAGGPLDRAFRDLHTAAAHVMVSPATYRAAGRVALGLEPEMLFF